MLWFEQQERGRGSICQGTQRRGNDIPTPASDQHEARAWASQSWHLTGVCGIGHGQALATVHGSVRQFIPYRPFLGVLAKHSSISCFSAELPLMVNSLLTSFPVSALSVGCFSNLKFCRKLSWGLDDCMVYNLVPSAFMGIYITTGYSIRWRCPKPQAYYAWVLRMLIDSITPAPDWPIRRRSRCTIISQPL
jgi:hypothetical protein